MALHASQMIQAALAVLSGQPQPFEMWVLPYSNLDVECVGDRLLEAHKDDVLARSGLWSACLLAARASQKRPWQYALVRYRFSQSLYAPFTIDLDPGHSSYLPLSSLPDDHIRLSYAILAAHSVVEDLGLEIRASASKPSRVHGEWNPVVRRDLEERLLAAGVDIEDPILWTLRGPRRRLEQKRPVPSRGPYPWSRGLVRDCKVELVDAIAHIDWLRDKVASHAARALTRTLSPYDVVNAQQLAGRLVLESLGFWRSRDASRLKPRAGGEGAPSCQPVNAPPPTRPHTAAEADRDA